ncbi:MAG: anhydro-N-acetylmuramic acid kinase [Alphaproteobacteria bacterium]|nr:anhydro-N-acetylmuramic acid kinase [Alphaproteobacteria bacterium]
MTRPLFRALGMMSGTSIDGIDAALIETDGLGHVRPLGFKATCYSDAFRTKLRACFGKREGARDPEVKAVEKELTELHAAAVRQFLEEHRLSPENIDLIGFHGQTIWHKPEDGETVQIGDGALLAHLTGLPVVNDFRAADVKAGGQGAPLVPLYHQALAARLSKPVAIINIGGVANITWIGGDKEDEILAFDTGPGNALIDDWIFLHTGQPYDRDGALAASGRANEALVEHFLTHPFFAARPPKSLDRDVFQTMKPEGLNLADGAATLTLMTVRSILEGLRHAPEPPKKLYFTGGGRHNGSLMRWIGEISGLPVEKVEALGWSGDGLEAEAFAYLAVRSRLGLPLSLPGTTGVRRPTPGGRHHGFGEFA